MKKTRQDQAPLMQNNVQKSLLNSFYGNLDVKKDDSESKKRFRDNAESKDLTVSLMYTGTIDNSFKEAND